MFQIQWLATIKRDIKLRGICSTLFALLPHHKWALQYNLHLYIAITGISSRARWWSCQSSSTRLFLLISIRAAPAACYVFKQRLIIDLHGLLQRRLEWGSSIHAQWTEQVLIVTVWTWRANLEVRGILVVTTQRHRRFWRIDKHLKWCWGHYLTVSPYMNLGWTSRFDSWMRNVIEVTQEMSSKLVWIYLLSFPDAYMVRRKRIFRDLRARKSRRSYH